MRRDKMEAAGKVPLTSGVVPLPSGVVGIHRSTLNSARWSPGHSADAVSRAAPLGAATFLALGINKAPNKAPTSGQDQEISTFSSSPRGTAREISSSPAMNRSPVDLFATFSRSPEQATEGLDGMNVITGEIRNRRTSKSGEKEATALDTRPRCADSRSVWIVLRGPPCIETEESILESLILCSHLQQCWDAQCFPGKSDHGRWWRSAGCSVFCSSFSLCRSYTICRISCTQKAMCQRVSVKGP